MDGIIFDEPHLELVPDSDGELHKLVFDWTVVFRNETYHIPAGFVTDGASVPGVLKLVCGSPYKVPRLYAALIHDWLYSGGDAEATRADADAIYRDIQIALGVSRVKAYAEWASLRVCGGSHWYNGEKE